MGGMSKSIQESQGVSGDCGNCFHHGYYYIGFATRHDLVDKVVDRQDARMGRDERCARDRNEW
jgi:hypothetical protein